MADVKKFFGYLAVDNSAHDSLKAAVAHTTNLKIREALKRFAASVENEEEDEEESLADWLFRHREAISAAYSEAAVLRAPRKPRAKKAANDTTMTLPGVEQQG